MQAQDANLDVTELWESQSHTLINTTHLNLKSSEQQKAKEKASQMDCGILTVESPSQLLTENEDINDYSCVECCNGIMGVPITFLDNYNPMEFEIIGITDRQNTSGVRTKKYTIEDSPKYNDLNARSVIKIGNTYKQTYARILIRRKQIYEHNNKH